MELKQLRSCVGESQFPIYLRNSVFVTATSVVLIAGLASLAAYALARYDLPWSNALYVYFLAGLMVPMRLGVLPLFLLMKTCAFMIRMLL